MNLRCGVITICMAMLGCVQSVSEDQVSVPTHSTVSGLTEMPAPAPAVSSEQRADSPLGIWSRLVPQAYVREVIEIRRDGTYISGVCGVIGMGWCNNGEATASRLGGYQLKSEVLDVDRGIVSMERGRTAVDERERYQWRVVRNRPDDPLRPTSRPPLRKLYLRDAGGNEVMYHEFPPDYRPQWVERSDR